MFRFSVVRPGLNIASRPAHLYPKSRPRCTAAHVLRNETPQEALNRRLRETQEVTDKVIFINSLEEFEEQLDQAGSRLVVVEIQADDICQMDPEEPDLNWKADKDARMETCISLKHTFQRTARNCTDVVFLEFPVDCEAIKNNVLLDRLNVQTYPTLQFWRNKKLLWQHEGATALEKDLDEGVLYYSQQDEATNLAEIHNTSQLNEFINSSQDGQQKLAVVDVSLLTAAPCVHIFPAVVALSRSFKGVASFGRVLGDESEETKQIVKDLGVVEVPTFVFFSEGKEIGRHVGSSRGDLIGKLLEVLASLGIQPPPPPPREKRKKVEKRRR